MSIKRSALNAGAWIVFLASGWRPGFAVRNLSFSATGVGNLEYQGNPSEYSQSTKRPGLSGSVAISL